MILLRPSIVFGPEDDFFNQFAQNGAVRAGPAADRRRPETKFQPVYVCDVAEAVARAVDGDLQAGRTYELGGPEVKTFRECLEMMLEITRRKRVLAPLPFPVASAMGKVMQMFPMAPITQDQVELLKSDNIVSEASKSAGLTLEGMGVSPATLASVLPTYLDRFREHGQYDAHKLA